MVVPGQRERAVYVPYGRPVRLRQTVPDVEVWLVDDSGRPIAEVMDLPEGWYCLPHREGE